MEPTRKFLVAWSRPHADNTAVIDWGWIPVRRGAAWLDRLGDSVEYCARIEQLYGLPRGEVGIYFGYRWYQNKELRDLQDVITQRGYKELSSPYAV